MESSSRYVELTGGPPVRWFVIYISDLQHPTNCAHRAHLIRRGLAVMAVPTTPILAHRLVGTRLVEAIAEEVGHGWGRAQPSGPGRQRLRCEAVRDLRVEVIIES